MYIKVTNKFAIEIKKTIHKIASYYYYFIHNY